MFDKGALARKLLIPTDLCMRVLTLYETWKRIRIQRKKANEYFRYLMVFDYCAAYECAFFPRLTVPYRFHIVPATIENHSRHLIIYPVRQLAMNWVTPSNKMEHRKEKLYVKYKVEHLFDRKLGQFNRFSPLGLCAGKCCVTDV